MKISAFALSLVPSSVFAFMMDTPIKANKIMKSDDIKYFSDLLHNNKLSPKMKCEITTREAREVRKFKDSSAWMETLEVSYMSNPYDRGLSKNFVISPGVKFGSRKSIDSEFGPIEEFRIELSDRFESYVEFSHDGKGQLLAFVFGDLLRIFPCHIKR